MSQRISYLNGKYLPHDNCLVHIEDRAFQFADGVYEVTLFENNKLIDAQNHLQRIMRSLKELNINHNFSIDSLIEIQLELFRRNKLNSGFCYLQISRGQANRQANFPKDIKPTINATVSEKKIFSAEEFSKGIKVITCEDIRWHRCDIKTVNLLASTLTNQKAKDQGFDDAIFVRDGVVTEATYANVFIVDKKNNLITHPVDNYILCGITRNRIINIALENKINVIEKKFSVDEMSQANEVFLTSSTLKIRPVAQIDETIIFSNDHHNLTITKLLNDKYQEFILNQ